MDRQPAVLGVGRDGEILRRHVPDFLLDTAAGLLVVDVKPPALLDEPQVFEVFDWCRRLCAGKGWRYEVWSGDDPVRLRNVRFLGFPRRARALDEEALVKIGDVVSAGMTLAEVEALPHWTDPQQRLPLPDLPRCAPHPAGRPTTV